MSIKLMYQILLNLILYIQQLGVSKPLLLDSIFGMVPFTLQVFVTSK